MGCGIRVWVLNVRTLKSININYVNCFYLAAAQLFVKLFRRNLTKRLQVFQFVHRDPFDS
jgi:hypothetical protein